MGKQIRCVCDNNGCGRDASKGYALFNDVMDRDIVNKKTNLLVMTVVPSPFTEGLENYEFACGRVCLAVLINKAIDRLDKMRKEKENAENIQ